jgi:hypothetical protein
MNTSMAREITAIGIAEELYQSKKMKNSTEPEY